MEATCHVHRSHIEVGKGLEKEDVRLTSYANTLLNKVVKQGYLTPSCHLKCNLHCYLFTGVLLYGPPGTGKTLLARACAAQTKSTFLKLAGPQLVQMFIGDGAKLVRDAFALAKEKAPTIIFIDELDAIGT